MQLFKFQRHSCKLSFFFLPCHQSDPESLLPGYTVATSPDALPLSYRRPLVANATKLLSVTSKHGHETKRHVLIGCQTWRVLPPNINFEVWQLLKQTVMPKDYVFDRRILLIFHFSQLSGIFLTQKQHTYLHKLFLKSKYSCKEYFVEQKQIKSTTAAYPKLWMFGGKTCHVCTQL